MAYFRFNGEPCLSAYSLKTQSNIAKLGMGEWYGKANAFHHKAGVDPSFAYLLFGNSPPRTYEDEVGLTIVSTDHTGESIETNTTTYEKMYVLWKKKVTPTPATDKGVYLVKLVDERYSLAQSLVAQMYNIPESFEPGTGEPVYNSSTTNSGMAWTWAQIFADIFELPSGSALDTSEATFPLFSPENLDFRYTTRRDALQQLCIATNTLLIPNPDGTYKLLNYPSSPNVINDILDTLFPYQIFNEWLAHDTPGHGVPKKIIFHFELFEEDENTLDEYEVYEETPATLDRSWEEPNIVLPKLRYPDQTHIPSSDIPSDIPAVYMEEAEKHFTLFPSQKITYAKLLYVPLQPGIEYVTYYDTTGLASTHLQTLLPIEWTPEPEEVTDTFPVSRQVVLLTSTINPASWEPSTGTLTPTSFEALLVSEEKDDPPDPGQLQTYTGTVDNNNTVEGRSYFPEQVVVTSGKARVATMVGGILFNVSCVEIDAPPSS